MDTTDRLGPLKFSLRATIDHHGPSIHSGHYTASINCCKKTSLLQRSHNYGVWSYWQQKLLYCICYTIWIGWHMTFGLEQEGCSLIAPMALAHPLHPIDNRSRYRRRNLWVGWCVSSWWHVFPSRSPVLIIIYIYALLYEFCFLWFTNCVLLSDDKSLIPGCLWLLAFILNNTLILGFWCSTIPHLPGCFCPWTFFQNIGFNIVPSDLFMSHLATRLGYSSGEFQALQLIVLATLGVVDQPLASCMLVHLLDQFGCRFDILGSISSFFFWHMQLYMSWYIIAFFGFIFTSQILFIFSSTPVLTPSIDVVFVLSIWLGIIIGGSNVSMHRVLHPPVGAATEWAIVRRFSDRLASRKWVIESETKF